MRIPVPVVQLFGNNTLDGQLKRQHV